MKKAYPYYNIASGNTYVIITKSQEEADIAMCNELRRQSKGNAKKLEELLRLTCAEKPVTAKKGKIGVSEGKYIEVK
jgi:hypothetical protein